MPASRPVLYSVPRLRSTVGERSESTKIVVDVVGTGEGQVLGREGLGHVGEQRVGLVTEQLFEVMGAEPNGRRAPFGARPCGPPADRPGVRFGVRRTLVGGPSDSSRPATS